MTDQEKIINDAEKALKNGFHNKALKLAGGIEDESIKATINALAEKMKAASKETAAKAPKKDPVKTKGEVTPQDIIDQYDVLLATLNEIEVQEKGKAHPYRFYYFHRRQIENLKRNFTKGMRVKARA